MGADAFGTIFGDGDTAGFFNVGQYDPGSNLQGPIAKSYGPDGNILDAETIAMLRAQGITGGPTPQMNAAQLGNAPQMNAAMLGPASLAGNTTIDQTQANETRAYQMGLMGQLSDQAQGKGPSLAGAQLQAGADANLANMMSAQASAKGGMGGALAGRQIAMQGAAQGQQTAQAAAMARIQEQMNAQQQLGGLSTNARGQDLSVAGQQAQLNQATGFANMGAQNQFALAQAGFQQQANAANQGMLGQYGLQQGQFDQGANQQNLGAKMWGEQNQGQWFDRYNNIAQGNRDARIKYSEDQTDYSKAFNDSSQRAYESTGANRGKFLSSFGGMMGMGI